MIPRSNSHKQHKVKMCYIGNPPFVSHYVSDRSFSDILPTIFCFLCGDGLSFPTQDHEGIPHWFTGLIGPLFIGTLPSHNWQPWGETEVVTIQSDSHFPTLTSHSEKIHLSHALYAHARVTREVEKEVVLIPLKNRFAKIWCGKTI